MGFDSGPRLDSGPGSDSGPRLDSGPGDATVDVGPATELDCPGIFDCVDVCDASDDPCIDACLDRGSAETLGVVADLVECAQENGCTDETCLETQCGPEVARCAGFSTCEEVGVPQMTGPITGLGASYTAGDPMTIGVPVDADTVRVSAGIYEVGSNLYLGGAAEDGAAGTVTLELFAGVRDGATGTFYIAVELCSTSICTVPTIRTTYQRLDRMAPHSAGETYTHMRENVGGTPFTETCTTSIPVQTFEID